MTNLRVLLLQHSVSRIKNRYGIVQTRNFSALSSHKKRVSINQRHMSTSSISETVIQTYNGAFLWVAQLPPTQFIQEQLCALHDHYGFQWWACIVSAAFILRCVLMLPAQITAQKTIAKRIILKEEMDTVLVPAIRRATDRQVRENGWSKDKAVFYFQRATQQIYKKKVIEYNCASSKIILPIILQVPIWIFTTSAVRNLSGQRTDVVSFEALRRLDELSTEGCLWFPNLAEADPTFVLPVLVGVALLAGSEVSSLQYYDKHLANPAMAKHMIIRNVLWRLVAVSLAGIVSQSPSAVAFYWFLSGSSAVSLNLLLMSPRVRRLVRIPRVKQEEQNPYRLLATNFGKRLTNQKIFFQNLFNRLSK